MGDTKKKGSTTMVKFVSPHEKAKVLADCGCRITKDMRCLVCGTEITLENIGAVRRSRDGTFLVTCNTQSCLVKSKLLFAHEISADD